MEMVSDMTKNNFANIPVSLMVLWDNCILGEKEKYDSYKKGMYVF